MKTQKVLMEFTIPNEWDTQDFVAELVGCYDEWAGEGKGEKVELRIIKPTTNEGER
jgi:hypothetical protein